MNDIEELFAVKLLTLLCIEVDSTVPLEHFTPRLRQLVEQAETVCTNYSTFGSWDELVAATSRRDARS